MTAKSTFILLTGFVAFFLSGSQALAQSKPKDVNLIKVDSLNILGIPIDSVETYGNLKFKSFKKTAHASYYADKFNGRRTASGKKFNNNKYTAAHRKLPFGTKVRVTNESNGKCVIVEITDRGPFVKGREIDLTRRAFMDIAHNKKSGTMNVSLEIVDTD